MPDRENVTLTLLALSLMSAAITCGATTAMSRRRTRRGCQALAIANLLTGALWVYVDQPVEGDVLISFTGRHGLTEADVFAGIPVLIALLLLNKRPRR